MVERELRQPGRSKRPPACLRRVTAAPDGGALRQQAGVGETHIPATRVAVRSRVPGQRRQVVPLQRQPGLLGEFPARGGLGRLVAVDLATGQRPDSPVGFRTSFDQQYVPPVGAGGQYCEIHRQNDAGFCGHGFSLRCRLVDSGHS